MAHRHSYNRVESHRHDERQAHLVPEGAGRRVIAARRSLSLWPGGHQQGLGSALVLAGHRQFGCRQYGPWSDDRFRPAAWVPWIAEVVLG